MTSKTVRLIGNSVLAIAVIILLINLAGMSGLIPKIWSVRDTNVLVIVMVIAARGMRRRRDKPVAPPVQPS
jgi:hypothetical protein